MLWKASVNSVYTLNRSIDSLIKSGKFQNARKLFDDIPQRDAVTYNLLISGYGKQGLANEAIVLYQNFVSSGLTESSSTFSSVISICSQALFDLEGDQVHCRVIKRGLLMNSFIATALVGFYMQMEKWESGLSLFATFSQRDLATWNVVFRGHSEAGRSEDVFRLFRSMRDLEVEGDGLTFSYLIRSCSDDRFLGEGIQLHCLVLKLGWVQSNVFVANALVDLYCACDMLNEARESFFAIPLPNVIAWDSIGYLYVVHGIYDEALQVFGLMRSVGILPSNRLYVGLLNLSSEKKDVVLGKQIHCTVVKVGLDLGSVKLQSALIDMYGKCDEIQLSISVYDCLPWRTLECCNPLMTSFMHAGLVNDVIETFKAMVDEGIGVDEVTISTTLKALCRLEFTSLASCELLNSISIKIGCVADSAVSCSLVDAYSKSGNLGAAEQVFKELAEPNVVCFTSMINAYARYGRGIECLVMLDKMIQNGLRPDSVTFLCVLCGCSHSGLVEEGRLIFHSMKTEHGIPPRRQHFSCMIDLLGRAGLVHEAEELLENSPGSDMYVMWSSLLRSCKVHRNASVGRRAAEILLELDPDDFSVYMQISNFYSQIGEFEDAKQARQIAITRKLKGAGLSSIEFSDSR